MVAVICGHFLGTDSMDEVAYLRSLGLTTPPGIVRKVVGCYDAGDSQYEVYAKRRKNIVSKGTAAKLWRLKHEDKLTRFSSQNPIPPDRIEEPLRPDDSEWQSIEAYLKKARQNNPSQVIYVWILARATTVTEPQACHVCEAWCGRDKMIRIAEGQYRFYHDGLS